MSREGRLTVNWIDHAILVAYLLIIFLIGACFARGQKSLKDYFLGGGNVPWWAAAFSGVATMVSAVSYLGGPGQAYRDGFTFLQYRLATPIAIVVICVVLLPLFYRLQLTSIYAYLERRFDLKTRLLASGLFILLRTSYLGLVIFAPALIVAEMLNWPVSTVILIVGVVAVAYTMLGGIRAVIWTDALQLMVLLGGLILATVIVLAKVPGGASAVWETAGQQGKLRLFDFSTTLTSGVTFWSGLIGGAFIMLGQYGVDQAEMQRFLTARSVGRGQLAVASSMLVGVLIGLLLFFLGAALFVFYLQSPALTESPVAPDRVFPKFILEQLPVGVRGLVLAGVLSAAMSTISSVLNSLTAVWVTDFHTRWSSRGPSVLLARGVTVSFGMMGIGIALAATRCGVTLLESATLLTTFFASPLVGVFLLGIFAPWARASSGFPALLSGFATVVLLWLLTPLFWMWYGPAAVVVVVAVGWISSRLPSESRASRH